ncbi:RING-type E3 ubiquitin transferase [Sarracenia purpurea var. burkii]
MQGQKSAGDSFTETVDPNQGSASNNTDMNQSTAWNSMLNPMETRWPNCMFSSAEGNYTRANAVSNNSVRGFSGLDLGESSSSAALESEGISDGLEIENGQSSWFISHPGSDARLEERQFETSNIVRQSVSNGIGGSRVSDRLLIMQSPSSSRAPLNANLNDTCHNLYMLSRPETKQTLSANASSDNFGTISGNFGTSSGYSGHLVDDEGESGGSLGNWGLSCKRKALEGTSGQSYPGGSSSFFQHDESFSRHDLMARYSVSRSLSMSPSAPSPSGFTEISSRNFDARGNLGSVGNSESVRFNLPPTSNGISHSDVCSTQQSYRSLSFTDSLDLRQTTSVSPSSNSLPNQPHSMHNIPGLSRNMSPFPWNGSLNSRIGGSSSSVMVSGDRGAPLREEENFRRTSGNSIEHPMLLPTEMRNLVQDPNNWNITTGNTDTSASMASSSRIISNSSLRPFPSAWISNHDPPIQNQQRLSEFAPWTLFPSVESVSGGQRDRFSPSRSGLSSEETRMSSGANRWRALAADIEGRQRLVSEIRQVLNAMRRNENLRPEDYMLIDPFINGVAELHDRHRDMRLDVDNMSYEELLALEERIGNVSTGLSEEIVMESMQRQKFLSITEGSLSSLEPCCICQEEYAAGDDVGILDCGHDFHSNCIKQWLTCKNLCPICKMTALGT